MKFQPISGIRLAAAASVLVLAGCAAFAGPAPWTHTEVGRSLDTDVADCVDSAHGLTLLQRGGAPSTQEEKQAFAVVLRRNQDRCMQENGWRRSRDAASDARLGRQSTR